mmetsp:Transcript_8065/g.23734  ORF Transcript_8065/g.23734 Transcript_8065/m.23734 type:complete len:345 (+) Transcript_8065:56-1090(+)
MPPLVKTSSTTGKAKRRTPLEGHKTIYLVRHGQADHNVTGDLTKRDPRLTDLGRRQSRLLDVAPVLIGRQVELVVSSPLRRTLETAAIGFGEASPTPRFVAHPDAQETGSHPSDTGVPAEELKEEFGKLFDLSLCETDWFVKPAPFDPQRLQVQQQGITALRERMARLAAWLLAQPEQSIALVAHHGVFGHLPGVEMELSNCEVVEASLDTDGWAVQRASGEVMLVIDSASRRITNYFGLELSATVSAIRIVHGKRAAIISERNNEVEVSEHGSAMQPVATVEASGEESTKKPSSKKKLPNIALWTPRARTLLVTGAGLFVVTVLVGVTVYQLNNISKKSGSSR